MKRPAPDKSFGGFLRNLDRADLPIAAAAAAIGAVFHALYPFVFTYPDSGAYVLSAAQEVFNIYRPMGYSDYLSLVHGVVEGTSGLFVVSYLLSALSTLFLLFSARYLLDIRPRWLFLTLCGLALLAPRIVFSTNFLMSDGLFNTLTMLFLATALWLCFTRSLWMAAAHLLFFALLYKVRFSGMFFVPVSVAALWMAFAGATTGLRAGAAAVPVVVFALLFTSVKKEYTRQTGVDTFSGFSGWQLLNNALVLMPEAKAIPVVEFEGELQTVHRFMQSVPDSIFERRYTMGTGYMWNNDLPLKQLLFAYIQATGRDYQRSWVEVGELYGAYAGALIRREPGRYAARFVWPSLRSTFRCHDMTEEGNLFKNEPLFADYFGIEESEFQYDKRFFRAIFPVRRVLNALWWAGWLAAAVWFFFIHLRHKRPEERRARRAVGLLFGFLLIYWAAAALASPNTTWRYTMPIFIPALTAVAWCASNIRSKITINTKIP